MQPSMTSFPLCVKPIWIIPLFHKYVMLTKLQKAGFISLVIASIILEHVKSDCKLKTINQSLIFLKTITGKISRRSICPFFFL